MRRNLDMTYIVMNNEIYGLTTGQTSPTTEIGMKTKSAPSGNIDMPLNPLALAVAAGCGYVARGFSGDVKQLTQLYVDAIKHPGFAIVDVFSPCVTFNKVNTYDYFKKRIYKLEDTGHDPSNFAAAIGKTQEWGDKIPTGLFYKSPQPRPSLDRVDPALKAGPLVDRPALLSKAQRREIVEEMM
jgi:2-oxoglutarate ferredoxin oxidoreductase subunit beta